MKRSAVLVAWSLLGVLAVAAFMITLSRTAGRADPKIDSYRPSGLAAFADLLRANGYEVTSTTSAFPRLGKNDIAVACLAEGQARGDDLEINDDTPGALGRLSQFIQDGGKAVLLPIDVNFDDMSSRVEIRKGISEFLSPPISVAIHTSETDLHTSLPSDLVSVGIVHDQYNPQADIASLTRYTDGTVLSFSDGYMATNRFIDRVQNADVLIGSLSTIAPKGSRLVFVESTFDNERPGLLEILGPGAIGAWYQSLFLFVVIVFTLGKRFGLPEEVRPAQTGQRELVNAVADTYRRARSTRAACRATYDRADAEVRKSLKLSTDAAASERDVRISPELATAFRHVFEGTIDVLPPQEAFSRCRTLRRLANDLTHPGK
ncbi:MAG TPA: DUF4350 domain-containing protein [Fimbriimonadaceae bacterium]|nr:DUF4350 domain-containing protein [Fimbriimonadaceae bacterium]